MMKTIALFGGTGRTGISFLKKALQDYKIKALVRNPEKLGFRHINLEVLKGDILNNDDVNGCIAATDAVVLLVGHGKNSPADLQTSATVNVLNAMKSHSVNRLISLTGGGVRDVQNDTPKVMDKLIVFIMKNLAGNSARYALLDGISHARLIQKSDLDWTIVRAPMLTDEPEKGKIEVGNVGQINGFKLSRADLAQFLLNEIESDKHIHQMPFLTNGN